MKIGDVNIAKKIYGPDIGALKGKTTRNKPTPVKNYLLEVSSKIIEQHCELMYCMEVMYVKNMLMLTLK